MKISFWLLDINPKIYEEQKVDLWLWGIEESGSRVLLVEPNFTAYFYAIIQDGADASKVADAIKNRYGSAIKEAKVVNRRYFGKQITAIKVSCRLATETGKLAKQLRSLEGVTDCLEDDIRAAMRYLIDNNIAPCAWHEAEVEEAIKNEEIRVEKVYTLKTPPTQIQRLAVPKLRVISFSMVYYSREGTPKSERNPVLLLSTVDSNGGEKQFLANQNLDDTQAIKQFNDYIKGFDPDIILNYGANTVDWAYLRGRSHTLGLHLDFDRSGFEPHTSVYGHVSATGVVNIDLADFTDIFPEVKVKTLWNLAEHLGVLKERQIVIDDVLFADYWDDTQKRDELKHFAIDSAHKVYGMGLLLLDFAMELSNLTSLPLDHVMTAATGFRVEWFLIKQVQKIGELIPRRIEQPYMPYAGGLVLSPKPGVHENIAVLDFKSMYPNIMLTYNLSPDTYIEPGQPEPQGGVWEAPEVRHRFRKSPPGFYKEALTYLINMRNLIRQKMETLKPRSVEYQVFDARQKAIKIITNAAYGYAGWIGARWYIKPVAEAASAWGRHTIQAAVDMAKNLGVEVVYGDTDSLFIHYEEVKALELADRIQQNLKLQVEIDQIYQRIFFTEAKKRYAGLRQDGTLDIVGLEVIRGDWAQVAKRVQEKVLDIILREQSPKKAVEYVRQTIADLKHKKVSFSDFIIWKTLTKPPEGYAIKAPHVEAAKMLKEKGWRLTSGDKVGYVVLSGRGRLYSRVKPYVFAKIDEIDTEYYITNQVLPAAARILSLFNITEAELLRETKETQEIRSLMDYV